MTKLDTKKDEYLAKIIHDLKTPIYAQIRALELFLETTEDKLTQEESDLIKLTLNSCDYMQKLVDIFNSVEKLNYEKLKLSYEHFDITSLVNSSLKELDILLKYHELKLYFNTKESIIVNADKLQIKRVIENLLSNSINYAFKNTEIKINLRKTKTSVIFEIENKSPYMESETLSEIFGKYKTKPNLYKQDGVGLGLYLSSEIINAHFGRMFADSKPDDKNIFGFELPL